MTEGEPGRRRRSVHVAGDALLRAWREHEDALRRELSCEPRRAERRALWRALAEARRRLERMDPARAAAEGLAQRPAARGEAAAHPFPPSIETVLASREDDWDAFLDKLEQGTGREPDATP